MNLILASQSPRRQQLLSSLGYSFITDPSGSEEVFDPSLSVDDALMKVALHKAEDVQKRHPEDVILAADTIVLLDGQILGKPADANEAKAMLHALSGRSHEVKTGLALICGSEKSEQTVTSKVHFRQLSDDEIDTYVATGSPLDKAGAYGIQEVSFASNVEGSFTNVIGLPLHMTERMLQNFQRHPEFRF